MYGIIFKTGASAEACVHRDEPGGGLSTNFAHWVHPDGRGYGGRPHFLRPLQSGRERDSILFVVELIGNLGKTNTLSA